MNYTYFIYLSERRFRTKFDLEYSDWEDYAWYATMISIGPSLFTQLKFTCSKSAVEILEKGVKYEKQQKHQNDVNEVVQLFLLSILIIFHAFF